MRGIRMRFEEQPGSAARPARRFPPPSAAAWRSARKSPTPCSTPTTCCATPEGTERQEKDVAQDLGGLQSDRRITPMALFALQAAADAGEPRVRLNPWRDWPPRRVQLADSACTSPNIACRRSRQASHRVRSSSRRMPARISMPRSDQRGAGPAPARWHRALAPTVEALPLMVCRVGAALDIALAELAFELGEEVPMSGTKRRNTGRSARAAARNAQIARASTSSPASAAVAGAIAPLPR